MDAIRPWAIVVAVVKKSHCDYGCYYLSGIILNLDPDRWFVYRKVLMFTGQPEPVQHFSRPARIQSRDLLDIVQDAEISVFVNYVDRYSSPCCSLLRVHILWSADHRICLLVAGACGSTWQVRLGSGLNDRKGKPQLGQARVPNNL